MSPRYRGWGSHRHCCCALLSAWVVLGACPSPSGNGDDAGAGGRADAAVPAQPGEPCTQPTGCVDGFRCVVLTAAGGATCQRSCLPGTCDACGSHGTCLSVEGWDAGVCVAAAPERALCGPDAPCAGCLSCGRIPGRASVCGRACDLVADGGDLLAADGGCPFGAECVALQPGDAGGMCLEL